MNDTPDRDPLADLLSPPPVKADQGLRHDLLTRTARVVRRRRLVRRAGLVAALTACYFAGLLTSNLMVSRTGDPAPVARREEPPETLPGPAVEDPAALASAAERAAFFRRAGDHSLDEGHDAATAFHLYTLALDAAPEEDTRFSPDDSWLLMALKNAREKEKRDANDDS